jgi:hypothetical protein
MARNCVYDSERFRTYLEWLRSTFETAAPEARATAGFAWRRDHGDETLLWCAGLDYELIMMCRMEACALLDSASTCGDASEALELRACAAAAFGRAAEASAAWVGGETPKSVWPELTERHNRDCALLASTVTHMTAVQSASEDESRCAALAAVHSSLVAHSDTHDPESPPCLTIALACSLLALETLVSNGERHLRKGDAPSAAACVSRCRELLMSVEIPEEFAVDVGKRVDEVLYITDRVTKTRTPFNAKMLAPAAELPKLF